MAGETCKTMLTIGRDGSRLSVEVGQFASEDGPGSSSTAQYGLIEGWKTMLLRFLSENLENVGLVRFLKLCWFCVPGRKFRKL